MRRIGLWGLVGLNDHISMCVQSERIRARNTQAPVFNLWNLCSREGQLLFHLLRYTENDATASFTSHTVHWKVAPLQPFASMPPSRCLGAGCLPREAVARPYSTRSWGRGTTSSPPRSQLATSARTACTASAPVRKTAFASLGSRQMNGGHELRQFSTRDS